MLSYRHAFHAGNHADVLKHFVQVQLHEYMNQKDTVYTYIDTHSGAGVYALDSGYASKNAEYDTGIAPLWERTDLPAPLADYVKLVKGLNPSGKMRYYPGSPYVADKLMREEDRLRLFELHPADAKILADNFRKVAEHAAAQGHVASGRGKRVLVERGDGFHALKTLLPPPSRRALVLIDPPYEDKQDYRKVRDAVDDALARFPTGTYAIWYPVLQRMESRSFSDKLKRLKGKDWLNVSLTVSTPGPDGFGLHTSGMFIVNPPYTLEPILRQVMPYLVEVLGKDEGATFLIESGVPLTGSSAARPTANGSVRIPVGNARRASPLSGTGSLRLPGQAPVGTPGAAGAVGPLGRNTAAKTSGRPTAPTSGRPTARTSGRPTAPGGRPTGPKPPGSRRP
ncbi:23S rRNA (adenine(2030)-N(6))-methyltransferase RlmJ [Massilia sp. DWR3-1-1]|uniref:23S rRNA (adenine(2030)-N(6))-methyltransferase RlmJ n=1 Tax=Massilia sp. DWR3-1-1 TaxID=2804559 RepID=UPI003CE6817C